MRKIVNKLHLILGLISGIVVFIVGITGSIYCFEEEIRNSIYSDLLKVDQIKSDRKPIWEMRSTVESQFPDVPLKNIRIIKDNSRSVEFILKNKLSVFVDPYSGKILGSVNKDKDFFGVSLKLHRSLLMDEAGKKVTGASALIFTIMLISGIILWWPLRNRFTSHKFKLKLNMPRKRIYDLHSVLGFYASWILIFSALTGLIWSYKWAENSMYWLAGSKKEGRKEFHSKQLATPGSIDEFIVKADAIFPGNKEQFVTVPEDSSGVYRMNFRFDRDGIFRKTSIVILDQYSGEIIQEKRYEKSSKGDKLKATNYDIHTGKAFGLPGQVIVFFAGLIAASLPVTGFMYWRARTKK